MDEKLFSSIINDWKLVIPLGENEVVNRSFQHFLSVLMEKPADSLNRKFVQHIPRRYFPPRSLISADERKSLLRLCIGTCLLVRSLKLDFQLTSFPELDILINEDTELFNDPFDHEYLSIFGAAVKQLAIIVNPCRNKGLFLDVCALFENRGKLYATGGDPSKETLRRVRLFESLTNVTPVKRRKRINGELCDESPIVEPTKKKKRVTKSKHHSTDDKDAPSGSLPLSDDSTVN